MSTGVLTPTKNAGNALRGAVRCVAGIRVSPCTHLVCCAAFAATLTCLPTDRCAADSIHVSEGSQTLTQTYDTTARYVRVKCEKTNPWETLNANGTWGFSFFGLTRDGARVPYAANAQAQGSDGSDASAVLSINRADGDGANWQRQMGVDLIVDIGETTTFNGYSYGQPWNCPGRAPYDFTIEISVDGDEWFLWETRKGAMSATYGTSDGIGSYAPRTDPQPVANSVPIFAATDTVTIDAGAELVLDHVNSRVPNLSGAGTLRLAGGRIILTGDCTFTGVIDGYGEVVIATGNAEIGSLSFGTTAFEVTNDGKARTLKLADGFLPALKDSANAPLTIELSGTVGRLAQPKRMVTAFGEAASAIPLHGKTIYRNAIVETLVGAPRLARFIRYVTVKGFSTAHVIGDIQLRLGGVRQALPTAAHGWQNLYATTNFTQHGITSQDAFGNRNSDRLRYLSDGDNETYYQWNVADIRGSKVEAYAQIDMPYPVAFDSVSIAVPSSAMTDNGALLPQQWIIETSVDGELWTQVQVQDSDYEYGLYPYKRGELRDDAVPESGNWARGAVEIADGTFEIANSLRYLKLLVYGLSGNGGTNVGTFLSFGEMQLHNGGEWQSWPSGVTAKWTGTDDRTVTNVCNSTAEFVTNVWNNYETNQARDHGGEAQWSVGSAETVAQGVGFVIDGGTNLSFDTYALYMGGQWLPNNRVPNVWTLSASYDGENYAEIDRCDNGYELVSERPGNWAYMYDHWFCTRAVDLSSLAALGETDMLPDDGELTIGEGCEFTLRSSKEKVGSLIGGGTVAFTGRAPSLTVSGADFSGSITGAGTLVLSGGTNHFDNANLSGVRKIVIAESAVVTGSAQFGGGDLTVESSGGVWAAEFSGIGKFSLTGDPLVMARVPADGTGAVSRRCFSYAETDSESKQLFGMSEIVGFKAKFLTSAKADDAAMRFRASKFGFIVIR